MAIPGLRPTFEIKAKVRIGEKKKTRDGKKEFPSSVDYFICDDPEFQRVVGGESKQLRIYLPFQHAADNFSTGLEWWQGKLLACYSKGEVEGGKPVALRRASMEKNGQTVNLLAGAELISLEVVGQDRRKIVCPVRECPILKRKDCKPMGRLQFWIDGIDKRPGVYQLDTKSWNSIENLEATLSQYPDLRGVPFVLRVEFTQRGRDRFPELYLEAEVEIKTEADVVLADALVQLRGSLDREDAEHVLKVAIVNVLEQTTPGWRDNDELIARLKDIGAAQAAKNLLDRYGL